MPYLMPLTLAAFDATPYLRLAKHGRDAFHATSSFVDGAYQSTWWETTLVLPILAVPEGQVHILQRYGCTGRVANELLRVLNDVYTPRIRASTARGSPSE